MNVLLISEHYSPKIGGTVSYLENTAVHLAKKGLNVFLLIPGLGQLEKLKKETQSENNITLLKIGVSNTSQLCFNPEERTHLCNWIKNNLVKLCQDYNINIVHLLYGLFIAAIIDTKSLQNNGIRTIHTVHNIPPFECSNSWKGDKLCEYLKDIVRKLGVKHINKKRIKKNKFDVYITPSQIVKNELAKYVNSTKIQVIGHGGAEYVSNNNTSRSNSSFIRILTVGGIVPHKNQLLIPKIAVHLKKNNIDFIWNIVGPIRNQRYFKCIKKEIHQYQLDKSVFINENVDDSVLNTFYNEASVYIHLSSEEGFCMTVLDAISNGIPVLALPAGAIPEMLDKVNGTILENNIDSLKFMITHYLKIYNQLDIPKEALDNFKNQYTWKNAVEQLITLYYG